MISKAKQLFLLGLNEGESCYNDDDDDVNTTPLSQLNAAGFLDTNEPAFGIHVIMWFPPFTYGGVGDGRKLRVGLVHMTVVVVGFHRGIFLMVKMYKTEFNYSVIQ